MFQAQSITSLELPELLPYRTMRRQYEHRAEGIFVAEGEKVVRRLLESPLRVLSALLPEKWLRDLEPVLAAREDTVQVYVAEKKLLETMTGFSMYQGLLAVGVVPTPPLLEDLISPNPDRPLLLAAVDGLSSAENVGALVRNAAALNARGLLVGETCASPFLRRAVRSSMGAVFHLPILESASLTETLSCLRERGVRIIAAHPHASGRTLPQADFTRDCCVVLGSEGAGISPQVLRLCDDAVAVPMPPLIDSLNVGSAAAVFLYEACRQRDLWRSTDR